MSERLDVLVCYDVETVSEGGKGRLRKMAKACSAYGQRVQYSVFELNVTPVLLERFLQRARNVMDERTDSLRVYVLAGSRERYLRVYGRDGWVDFEDAGRVSANRPRRRPEPEVRAPAQVQSGRKLFENRQEVVCAPTASGRTSGSKPSPHPPSQPVATPAVD